MQRTREKGQEKSIFIFFSIPVLSFSLSSPPLDLNLFLRPKKIGDFGGKEQTSSRGVCVRGGKRQRGAQREARSGVKCNPFLT